MRQADSRPLAVEDGMLPVCSRDDCARIQEQLLDLQAFWIPRHPRFPFHTLGATNYYDLAASLTRPYFRLAQQYNALLLECFGGLFEQLRLALEEHLNGSVAWLADSRPAALPGFHLFLGHERFAEGEQTDVTHAQWFARRDGEDFPGNPVHADTAHLALGLEGPTLSFTLPIALPRSGAGMRVWPVRRAQAQGLADTALLGQLSNLAFVDMSYTPGRLWLHGGDAYHKALGLPRHEEDVRFTLQGHGVWHDDRWQLFW